jgi:hypothetical protein
MRSPVTPHPSLTGETKPAKLALVSAGETSSVWTSRPATKLQMVGFCDWISIYQHHPGCNLPRIADGAVVRIDRHGETECMTLKKSKIEGSHETAVFVRCDGETVWFDGNVSKWGRTDNIFGYSFQQCLLIINNLLASLELPPFTDGEKFITNFKGQPRTIWTGAKVTRVDLTENYSVGSKENAYHYMRYLESQQSSRLKTGTYGEGETVDFGRGSRVVYFKAYLKGPELRRHISKTPRSDFESSIPRPDFHLPEKPTLEQVKAYNRAIKAYMGSAPVNPYVLLLADWCDLVGLVRVEMTFKSTKLHQLGCNYLGGFDMKQLEIDFTERCEILSRASADVDELTDLPKQVLSTYRMWQAGDDVVSKISRATFYRHRRELLPYGVDIAIKSNVVQLKTKTRVIKLGPVAMPDWYELPEIERKRYVSNGR